MDSIDTSQVTVEEKKSEESNNEPENRNESSLELAVSSIDEVAETKKEQVLATQENVEEKVAATEDNIKQKVTETQVNIEGQVTASTESITKKSEQVQETAANEVESFKETSSDVIDSVKEQGAEKAVKAQGNIIKVTEEVSQTTQQTEDQAKEKVLNVKEQTQQEASKIQEEAGNLQAQTAGIQDQAGNLAASASTMNAAVKNVTKSSVNSDQCKPSGIPGAITECTVDKDEALYAMKVVRALHGLEPLDWDDELAKRAASHAMYLAQTKTCEVSGIVDIGENIYIAKGTSQCSKVYQAILEWYKSATQFNFKSIGTVSDSTGPFTQLVWDTTKYVGVGCVYAEETRTSYIVANFSPPGNYGDSRNYIQHVKQPTAGLPPRLPKLNDLMNSSSENNESNGLPTNMGSIFGVLCHWCATMEDKPEVKVISAKPKVLVKIQEESTNEKTTKQESTKSSETKEDTGEGTS